MQIKTVKFQIEVEMHLPYVEGKTTISNEVRAILDDCLPGVNYWDFVEGREPKVIDTLVLKENSL